MDSALHSPGAAGARVLVADCVEALAAARDRLPDLAVPDVSMPGATALEICAALRADPEGAGTRILPLSAGASPDEVVGGLSAGADAYLAEPFPVAGLVQHVRALTAGVPA